MTAVDPADPAMTPLRAAMIAVKPLLDGAGLTEIERAVLAGRLAKAAVDAALPLAVAEALEAVVAQISGHEQWCTEVGDRKRALGVSEARAVVRSAAAEYRDGKR